MEKEHWVATPGGGAPKQAMAGVARVGCPYRRPLAKLVEGSQPMPREESSGSQKREELPAEACVGATNEVW